MKRFIGLMSLLLVLLPFPSQSAERKLRIGVEGAYPPFSEVGPDGKLKGFDIDFAQALCEHLKAQCTLVQLEFDGMIPSLAARKVDAVIASMTITEERKKAVDFSARYYRTPNRMVAKKGANLVITPDGLKGKKIGVQRSTINDRFVTETFTQSQIVRYAKQDDAFLDLASGRLDLTLVDAATAYNGFLKSPAGKHFEITGPGFNDPRYFGPGAGVAVRKGDKLAQEITAGIAALRASGAYQRIQAKYFDFDIYGADPAPKT